MDTGLLYRAAALAIFRFGGDLASPFEARRACDDILSIPPEDEELRSETVGNIASRISAYPGVRHLQVLKAFGDNAIVASICPKNSAQPADPAADPDYGYNPAVAAIVSRTKAAFRPSCLPRPISTDVDGQIPCTVVEVTSTGACS